MAQKAAELLRIDVKTNVEVSCFLLSLHVVVDSMGSAHIAGKTALAVARDTARAGLVYGIRENVSAVRECSERLTRGHPTFKDRPLMYLTNKGWSVDTTERGGRLRRVVE